MQIAISSENNKNHTPHKLFQNFRESGWVIFFIRWIGAMSQELAAGHA